MADRPIILAMANPEPEIRPELAKEVRPGLPDRHRPFGLPEPGQQLAVLPVPVPRRARLRREHDQRGDEARRRALARGARARGAVRNRRAGVRRSHAALRSRLPHSARVRSAAHHQHGARGGEGGDGQRRGDASDQGFRRLSRPVEPVRLRIRRDDGTGVRRGQARAEARRLRGRRGRARAARRPGRRRRGPRAARAGGPHRDHRVAHSEARAAADPRPRLRRRQHPRRHALSRLLVRVLPVGAPQRA